jgi:hypothetical protein
MRRRISLAVAALAASGVVALCVGAVLGASAGADPRPAAASADLSRMPSDLVWRWVLHCAQSPGVDSSVVALDYTVGAGGELAVEFGWSDELGHVTVDPRTAAATKSCIEERTVDPATIVTRMPTPAERLLLYTWAVERQRPCLADRGMNVPVASPGDFLDVHKAPWYLLDGYAESQADRGLGVDFDTLLGARLACPPMPAFLAAQGVGW